MTLHNSGDHHIHVSHKGGDRFAIHVRGHRVVVDQPHPGGGAAVEAGPTPTELFVAALAACSAFFAQKVLDRGGDGLSVEVGCDYAMSDDHRRVGSIDLTVSLPAGLSEERSAAVLRAVHHCTVHQSLQHPPQVSVKLGETQAQAPGLQAENADARVIMQRTG